MPRITEDDLDGLRPFEELCEESKEIARRFLNDVFLFDPRANPSMLTRILVEANAKPSLQRLVSNCLSNAKAMFAMMRRNDPKKVWSNPWTYFKQRQLVIGIWQIEFRPIGYAVKSEGGAFRDATFYLRCAQQGQTYELPDKGLVPAYEVDFTVETEDEEFKLFDRPPPKAPG